MCLLLEHLVSIRYIIWSATYEVLGEHLFGYVVP